MISMSASNAITEGPIVIDGASYFLSKLELSRGKAKTMPTWRKRLFIATAKFSTDASHYFGLDQDKTVIMGERVEI